MAQKLLDGSPAQALAEGLAELEKKFRIVAQSSRDPSGACALAALVIGRRVYLGNVGDCRAALVCFAGALGVRVRSLTSDHKPSDLAERARVKAAGGAVRRKTITNVRSCERAVATGVTRALKTTVHPPSPVPCVPTDLLVVQCGFRGGGWSAACVSRRAGSRTVHW